MALPAQHGSDVASSANGTDDGTSAHKQTTATITNSTADLITVILETDLDTAPTWTFGISASTFGTEDSNPSGQGILYGDGTSANHTGCVTTNGSPTVTDATVVAADVGKLVTGAGIPANTYVSALAAGGFTLTNNATASATVTLAFSSIGPDVIGSMAGSHVYIWSARVDLANAGLTVTIAWNAVAAGSNRRYTIRTHTAGSGDSFGTRAARLVTSSTANLTGWASGGGDQQLTGLSTTTRAVVLVSGVNTGGTTNTVTLDADADGTFELSDVLNSSGTRAFYGYYDTGTAHRPGATVKIRNSGTWGTPNAWALAVYKVQGPTLVAGAAVVEHDHPVAGSSGVGNMVTGHAVVEHDIPHVGSYPSGPVTGQGAVEHDHPVAGISEVGVQVAGNVVVEHDAAFGIDYTISSDEVHLQAPTAGTHHRILTLSAKVAKLFTTDVGDIRFSLRDGATVVNQTPWTALTDTLTRLSLDITGAIADETDLRFHWDARTPTLTGSLAPDEEDVILNVEYWTVEANTPHAGSIRLPPVRGGTVVEHDLAYRGTNFDVVLKVGRQRDAWTIGNEHDTWHVAPQVDGWSIG